MPLCIWRVKKTQKHYPATRNGKRPREEEPTKTILMWYDDGTRCMKRIYTYTDDNKLIIHFRIIH